MTGFAECAIIERQQVAHPKRDCSLVHFLLFSEVSEMKIVFHFRASDNNKRFNTSRLAAETCWSRACPGVLIPFIHLFQID